MTVDMRRPMGWAADAGHGPVCEELLVHDPEVSSILALVVTTITLVCIGCIAWVCIARVCMLVHWSVSQVDRLVDLSVCPLVGQSGRLLVDWLVYLSVCWLLISCYVGQLLCWSVVA